MEWTQLFFAILLSIGTLMSVGIAVFAWRRRSIPGAEYFAIYALAVALWCFGATLTLISDNPTLHQLIGGQVGSITIVAIPIAWLAFTMRYTGWVQTVTTRAWVLMTALPVAALLLGLGLDIRDAVQTSRGPEVIGLSTFIQATISLINIAVVVNIILQVLFGSFLIIQRLIQAPKAYRWQYFSILAGMMIPWSLGIPAMFLPQISDQVLSIAIVAGLLVIVWGIFRHQVFDILPIALETVIQSMGDGVIVLDDQQRIVHLNPAAQAILQHLPGETNALPDLAKGQPVYEALAGWSEILDYFEQERFEKSIGLTESISSEFNCPPFSTSASDGEQKATYYEVRVSPLHDRWQALSGWLIFLHDITERKLAQEVLAQQTAEAAVDSERNRLARDLHDSVTQSLYSLTLHAEAAARNLSSGQVDTAADYLHDLQVAAKEAHGEMRQLIFALRPPILEKEGLAAAIEARLESLERQSKLKTIFNVDLDDRLPYDIEEGLYRIAQEALNNCLKHAQAQEIIVSLHHDKKSVSLEIVDDGLGFKSETVRDQGGLGLAGIEERVAQLGGTLTLTSEPGNGTQVKVEVWP